MYKILGLLMGVMVMWGGLEVEAQEIKEVKLFPVDIGFNALYDWENLTDWSEARDYQEDVQFEPIIDREDVEHRFDDFVGLYRLYR